MNGASLDTFFVSAPADLGTCDREPIHIPGAIQAHGVLLVFDSAARVLRQASANTALLLGKDVEGALGQTPEALLGPKAAARLRGLLAQADGAGAVPDLARIVLDGVEGAPPCYVAVHHNEAGWVVELEPAPEIPVESATLMAAVEGAMQRLRGARSIEMWCDVAAREVQRLSGFDRVMVYRFDDQWRGQVVAEALQGGAESFLGLHFPATDIPQQARRLYVLNLLRFIADANYTPIPIVPAASPGTGQPLDLSQSLLRSVSPVHVEYLQNMGVGASMSISIVQGEELWGLIACHHAQPRLLPQPVRAACGLLGQVLSLQLPLQQERERAEHEQARQAIHARLLENTLQIPALEEALTQRSPTVLDLVEAQGAAVLHGTRLETIGQVPSEALVRHLAAQLPRWIEGDSFATDRLAEWLGDRKRDSGAASGLLAIPIGAVGQGWVMWFREEQLRTVVWAGEQEAAHGREQHARISPRKSFARWREEVRGTSAPWLAGEVAAAEAFRRALVEVVLQKAEELTRLNQELDTANRALRLSNRELQEFATVMAHDLKEPLRKISTFADLIGSAFGASVTEEGQFFLQRMQHAAQRLMTLVNDVLVLSQISNRAPDFKPVALDEVVAKVQDELREEITVAGAAVQVEALPSVWGDRAQLQLLLRHLLSNALKFQPEGQVPEIRIASHREQAGITGTDGGVSGPTCCITVTDNGIGFEEKYAARIFNPFEQLHAGDRYDGTGVGLAICRRIAARHDGTIRVRSAPGKGSTFTLCLPLHS